MKPEKSLFPEDKQFFLNFLKNEVIYHSANVMDCSNHSPFKRSDFAKKITQKNYQTCLFFSHLDEDVQLKPNSFLDKILQAVGLSFENTLIINLEQTGPLSFHQVHNERLLPEKIIFFGLNLAELDLNIHLSSLRVNKFLNYQIIHTVSLTELQENMQVKKSFWKLLQMVYLNKQ